MRFKALLIIWLLADICIFTGMYALAYFMRVGWILSTDYKFENHMLSATLATPLFLGALIATRTFGLTRKQASIRNIAYIGYSTVIGVSGFTLVYYFLNKDLFSRLLLIHMFVLSTVGVVFWHVVFDTMRKSILRKSPAVFRALVVGVTRESIALIKELNSTNNPITPVAILDAQGTKETAIDGVPVKGKLNKLEATLSQEGITHLIQCADLEQSLNLLSACRQKGITYILLPSVLGIVERDERVESLAGHPVTMVSPKEHKWLWFFK